MTPADTTGDGRVAAPASPDSHREPSPAAAHPIGRINLAHEAPLRMGALTIEPGLRRVARDDGREEIEQPRVMQVLVALIRAGGQILSRDDLLTSCWQGVVVGEDAINRVMGRVRRLAQGIGEGEFKLETITRVGYRLVWPKADLAAPPRAPALPDICPAEPLLAVLAFDNLSGDPGMAYFSDGVSEEIQQTVAQGTDLKVIGRTSSFRYRGADKTVRRVAEDLKATHVLDGSVRRSGARVRISAQLIECAGATTLWSDRFDRDLSDVFALQDEIASAVAAALKVVFAPTAKAQAIDPEAFDLYLRARALEGGPGALEAKWAAAIEPLERAVALAPGFARAWGRLASIRALQLRLTKTDRPYAVARAKVVEAAVTALRLDPGLGDPHQTLADLEPFANYVARETLHYKALAAAPNDPDVLVAARGFFAALGRTNEAVAYAKRAFDLDPMLFGAVLNYAAALDAVGRSEESRPVWDRALRHWPDSELLTYAMMATAYYQADWRRFDDMVRRAQDAGPIPPYVEANIEAGRHLRAPGPQSTKRFLEQARDQLVRTKTLTIGTLMTLCHLDLRDQAFELIEAASFAYMFDPEQPWAAWDFPGSFFSLCYNKPMMRDPRFPRLCAKFGLCDYWVKTNRWPDCAEEGALPYDFKAECRRLAPT